MIFITLPIHSLHTGQKKALFLPYTYLRQEVLEKSTPANASPWLEEKCTYLLFRQCHIDFLLRQLTTPMFFFFYLSTFFKISLLPVDLPVRRDEEHNKNMVSWKLPEFYPPPRPPKSSSHPSHSPKSYRYISSRQCTVHTQLQSQKDYLHVPVTLIRKSNKLLATWIHCSHWKSIKTTCPWKEIAHWWDCPSSWKSTDPEINMASPFEVAHFPPVNLTAVYATHQGSQCRAAMTSKSIKYHCVSHNSIVRNMEESDLKFHPREKNHKNPSHIR